MGNRLSRRRQVVNDNYTRPQGLDQIRDVDYRKVRKLILESRLAPCYPGDDECDDGPLEECPICFLYYPTLNFSKCCRQRICTVCFLQVKNHDSTTPSSCPFCKTLNFAVEYKGAKSKEDRTREQNEEQKVAEAKIRMRQREVQDEEKKPRPKKEVSFPDRISQIGKKVCSTSEGIDCEEITTSSRDTSTAHRQSQNSRQNRADEFDLVLEDLMVLEAIWLSMQEKAKVGHTIAHGVLPGQYITGNDCVPSSSSPDSPPLPLPSSSPSPSPLPTSITIGGLAGASAALAKRRELIEESSYSECMSPSNMLPSSSGTLWRSCGQYITRNDYAPSSSSSSSSSLLPLPSSSPSPSPSPLSPSPISGGLAGAFATLARRRELIEESSYSECMSPSNMLPSSSGASSRALSDATMLVEDHEIHHLQNIVEPGTCYKRSDNWDTEAAVLNDRRLGF